MIFLLPAGGDPQIKQIPKKGGNRSMEKKRRYRSPGIDFVLDLSEQDILTSSEKPIIFDDETPLIFFETPEIFY